LNDEDYVYKFKSSIMFAIDGFSLTLVEGAQIDFE